MSPSPMSPRELAEGPPMTNRKSPPANIIAEVRSDSFKIALPWCTPASPPRHHFALSNAALGYEKSS